MTTASQVSAKDVSIGEFVTILVLRLDKQNIPMPFQNEEKWHRLFYNLKTSRDERGRPAFLDALRFDWDGWYPKCRDLSECLQTLHLNGFISVANPTYDKFKVDDDVLAGIDEVQPEFEDNNLEHFLAFSTQRASQLFTSGV